MVDWHIGQVVLCGQGCPAHLKGLSSILGLYPLGASSNTLPPLQHCQTLVYRYQLKTPGAARTVLIGWEPNRRTLCQSQEPEWLLWLVGRRAEVAGPFILRHGAVIGSKPLERGVMLKAVVLFYWSLLLKDKLVFATWGTLQLFIYLLLPATQCRDSWELGHSLFGYYPNLFILWGNKSWWKETVK